MGHHKGGDQGAGRIEGGVEDAREDTQSGKRGQERRQEEYHCNIEGAARAGGTQEGDAADQHQQGCREAERFEAAGLQQFELESRIAAQTAAEGGGAGLIERDAQSLAALLTPALLRGYSCRRHAERLVNERLRGGGSGLAGLWQIVGLGGGVHRHLHAHHSGRATFRAHGSGSTRTHGQWRHQTAADHPVPKGDSAG